MINKLRIASLTAIIALASLVACQTPTQPVDLTASRTMTVELKTTTNVPVPNATIDWTKYTGINAPISSRTTSGTDGFARFTIPDVSANRDSVQLLINVPSGSPGGPAGPFDIRTSVCNDTLISLAISPDIPCGTLNRIDTIELEVCPSAQPTGATACRYYPTTCQGGVIFTVADTSLGSIGVSVASSGGTSSTAEVCATFAPATDAVTGATETLTTVVEGRLPGQTTVLVRIGIVVLGRVTCEQCPCPTFNKTAFTAENICLGNSAAVALPLSTLYQPLTGSAECVTEFTLVGPGDPSFVVSPGPQFTVRNGQAFPMLDIDVNPTAVGTIQKTLTYNVRTRNRTTGVVTECPAKLVVDVTIPVISTQCVIRPQRLDTLEKCVFNDSSTVDTFFVENTGECPVTVTITSASSLFQTSPRGTVVIPARSTMPVAVTFLATKADWDNNPQTPVGARGDKFFTSKITVTGCEQQPRVYDVVGAASVLCSSFKYQCLRQFRPPGFPNVYAESIQLVEDKTNIVYQNDNQRFTQYDIYVKSLTPNGAAWDVELGSGEKNGLPYGLFKLVTRNFTVNPGESICDRYPANASADCSMLKNDFNQGASTISGLRPGDVVLYMKNGSRSLECALIWIQSTSLDRPGTQALPQVCIEICYPMFTL
jgi:hypothetical protein